MHSLIVYARIAHFGLRLADRSQFRLISVLTLLDPIDGRHPDILLSGRRVEVVEVAGPL